MKTTTLKISEIKNNPNNPRLIKDDKFKKLVQSIKEFPEMLDAREIVVNTDNIILGGNMRFKAAKEAGLKEVPVKIVDWSEDKQRQFVIKDNVSGGEWDWDSLANEWEAEELDAWGLDTPADWAEETEIEEDEAPEVSNEPPVSKLGEVYQLGRHKVFCGDSTLRTSYEKLMGGSNADLVFTDPPYGMKKENEGVLNDNLNYDDLLEFNKQWVPLSFDFMKENGSWYCWGIDEPLMDIYSQIIKPMARKQQVTFRNLITWDKFYNQKPTAIEQQRSYVVYDEKCLFVMGGVQGFNNNSDNYYEGWEPLRLYLNSEMEKVGGSSKWREALGNQMGGHYFTKSQWSLPTEEAYMKLQSFANGAAFKREYSALKREYDRIKSEWMATRAYFDNTHETYMTEVWRFETAGTEEREGTGEHATPKPISLCSRAIKSSSRDGETVMDVFLGSGSTIIACEQTDRTCYGMELDPKYVDVIRKRYHKFVTGSDEGWEDGTQRIV